MMQIEQHTEERRAEMVNYIPILLFGCFALLLLMSHITGQTIYPLRGLFIATGLLLLVTAVLVYYWKGLRLSRAMIGASSVYFVFTLWACIRTLFVAVPSEAYPFLGTFIEGFWVFIASYVLFSQFRNHRWLIYLMFALLVLASLYKALGQYLWQFAAQLETFDEVAGRYPEHISDGIRFALTEKRVFSFYGNPNIFCGFLAMMLPLMLWFTRTKPFLLRIAGSFLSVLILITAVLTGSRGGMLAVFLGLITLLLLGFTRIHLTRKTLLLLSGVVVILVVVGFIWLGISAKSKGTTWRQELGRWTNLSTIRQRQYYNHAAMGMISSSPVTGHGLGSYGLLYPKYKDPDALESRYAHNFITQMWAESGIVGVVLLLVFIGIIFSAGIRHMKGAEHVDGAAILAAISAFLFSSLWDYTFYFREFYLDFMILGGLMLSFSPAEAKEQLPAIKSFEKILLVTMLILTVIAGWKTIFQHQAAENYYETGLNLVRDERAGESVEYFQRAIRVESENPDYYRSMGKTLIALNNLPGGMRYLEEAQSRNPYSAGLHSELAEILLVIGFRDRAVAELQKAIELYPSKADYHYALARVYALSGHRAEAREEIKEAIRFSRNKNEEDEYRAFMEELSDSGERRSP